MTIDVRKAQPSTIQPSKARAFEWVKGLRQEFHKISWTTKDELKVYTKVVVTVTVVIGIGIYLADLLVQGALSGVGALIRAVIG